MYKHILKTKRCQTSLLVAIRPETSPPPPPSPPTHSPPPSPSPPPHTHSYKSCLPCKIWQKTHTHTHTHTHTPSLSASLTYTHTHRVFISQFICTRQFEPKQQGVALIHKYFIFKEPFKKF